MRGRCASLMLLLLLCTACSQADNPEKRTSPFASMVDAASNAPQVVAGTPVSLPADHASHPAFRLEWWYLTATFTDDTGTPYGFQFTLFRIRQPQRHPSEWSNAQRWLAHVSLHSQDAHYFEEKIARGGVGNAGIETSPFRAFIDQWQWRASDITDDADIFPSTLSVSVSDSLHLHLSLNRTGPSVLHGENGFSTKSADGTFRSYYYSEPFIRVSGTLTMQDQQVKVAGDGWFDHEWTSQLASDKALGWDWLSLSLDDGRKLMAFTMHVDGSSPYTTGTLISADGSARTLDADAITLSPSGYETYKGKQLPVHWSVSVPSAGINLDVSPFKAQQWNPGLVSYYEGRVEATGSHRATGFLELTGY